MYHIFHRFSHRWTGHNFTVNRFMYCNQAMARFPILCPAASYQTPYAYHRMYRKRKDLHVNNIYLKFSEYALLRDGQHPFANKYGATAEAIFTEYTTNEDIVNSSVEDLVAFINLRAKVVLLIQKKQQKSYS